MKLIINNDKTIKIQNNTSEQIKIVSYSIFTNKNNTEPVSSNIPQPPIIIDGGATTNILTDYHGNNMTFDAATQEFKINYLPPPPDVSGIYKINRAVTNSVPKTPDKYISKIEKMDIHKEVPTTTPYSLTSSTPVLFTTTPAPESLGLVVNLSTVKNMSALEFRTAVTYAAEIYAAENIINRQDNKLINIAIGSAVITVTNNDILMKLSTYINVNTWIEFVKSLRPSNFNTFGTPQYIALYKNGSQIIYCNPNNSGCSNGIIGPEEKCIYPNYYCNDAEDVKIKQCNSI